MNTDDKKEKKKEMKKEKKRKVAQVRRHESTQRSFGSKRLYGSRDAARASSPSGLDRSLRETLSSRRQSFFILTFFKYY
jgi:hypothetical protein